jgi:hypothetical protein
MDWTSVAVGALGMTWLGLILIVIVALVGRKK